MKTKLFALLLLVVLTCSLASCSFIENSFIGKIFGKDPAVTTTATPGLSDPLRTDPPKSTTATPADPTAPKDPWDGPIFK